MKVFFNDCQLDRLPQLTLEEKLQVATRRMSQFWNTPLRSFWRNVYIHYRDELYPGRKKAGKPEASGNPASNNHDGKPAA